MSTLKFSTWAYKVEGELGVEKGSGQRVRGGHWVLPPDLPNLTHGVLPLCRGLRCTLKLSRSPCGSSVQQG